MPVTAVLQPEPSWVKSAAPEQDTVVLTQLTLVRNIADFPFADRCSADERQSVEERALAAFESINLFSTGDYLRLRELDSVSARVLAERRL